MKFLYQVLFDNTNDTSDYYDSAIIVAGNPIQVVGIVMEELDGTAIKSVTKVGLATQEGVLNGVLCASFNAG